jgi:hypothetical protein
VKNNSSANVFDRESDDGVPSKQGTSDNRDDTTAVDAVINYIKIIGSKEEAGKEDMSKFMNEAKEEVEGNEGETA